MFLAVKEARKRVGFPDWERVSYRLDDDVEAEGPGAEKVKSPAIKNTEIRILDNYEVDPEYSFWENFPRRSLPEQVSSRVNIKNFKEEIELAKPKMSEMEKKRADKVIKSLSEGADTFLESVLPPMNTKNAKSAYENGAVLTDTIATWIMKGFVAGPFDFPPVEGFCANPLAAVVRNGKVTLLENPAENN